MEEKVISLLSNLFKVDKSELSLESTDESIAKWDSLGHLNMVLSLEKEFKIKVNTMEALQLDSIQKIVTLLEKKAA